MDKANAPANFPDEAKGVVFIPRRYTLWKPALSQENVLVLVAHVSPLSGTWHPKELAVRQQGSVCDAVQSF